MTRDPFITRADLFAEDIDANPFGRFNIVVQLKDASGEVLQNVEVPVSGTTYSDTVFNNLVAVAKGEMDVVDNDGGDEEADDNLDIDFDDDNIVDDKDNSLYQ